MLRLITSLLTGGLRCGPARLAGSGQSAAYLTAHMWARHHTGRAGLVCVTRVFMSIQPPLSVYSLNTISASVCTAGPSVSGLLVLALPRNDVTQTGDPLPGC